MTLEERQMEYVEMFNSLDNWKEKFQYLIDSGEMLPDLPEHLRIETNRIRGCVSRTFFLATAPAGEILIQGWSNTATPSGLIAIIKDIFDGYSPEELRRTPVDFHIRTGLIDNLTEQRKAGLLEMISKLQRL